MLIDPQSTVWLRCDRCHWIYARAAPGESGFPGCFRCKTAAPPSAFTIVDFDVTLKGATISSLAMPGSELVSQT